MAGFPTFLFAPFARKDAFAGDYLHGLIAVSIRRERRNFFVSYKGAAAEKKKSERRKDEEEERNERDGRSFPYSIVDKHNGASDPSTSNATIFVLMRNEVIR